VSATAPIFIAPPSGSARLFLALCPGQVVQAALATHAKAWHWNEAAARYAPPDWHVTLHFIGAVPRSRVDELRAGLDVPVQPFELRFGQPVLWPHGLAVLLPMAVPAALQELHAQLGHRLRQLDLRTDERPYRPHLTLARRAQAARLPVQWPAWGWSVQGYALMESTGEAGPDGQRYRMLQQYGRPDDASALQP
jgi:RNA 2',3'-cyclic 3'-phosphodiesterase